MNYMREQVMIKNQYPMIHYYNTGKSKGVMVEVQQNAKGFVFGDGDRSRVYYNVKDEEYEEGHDYRQIVLPNSNYSIVGLLRELSEEQWREIVDGDAEWIIPATVYGYALAESIGCTVVNPLGDKEPVLCDAINYTTQPGYIKFRSEIKGPPPSFESFYQAWQSAQSKVKNYLVLTENEK